PHAVLCRTNAAAVRRVIEAQASGRRPFLVGNGSEVLSFARAAAELQTRGHTSHPELACFTGWPGVQAYVENDPSGSELRLLVRLVDEFGTDTITDALGRLPREADADVVVSTAHKSKGREWSTVALADDFPAPKPGSLPDPAELRLLYVAVTRARHTLDITACPALAEPKPKPVTVPQPPKEASAA
ncbi:MAG TPA: ATP-binding domain-containing protein, partial [Acidimicrobiales bacterium]